jgi:hypothetical protein
MICNLCRGSGSLICFNPREWWDCPKCGGAGVSVMGMAPPTIQVSSSQLKKAGVNKKAKWKDPKFNG